MKCFISILVLHICEAASSYLNVTKSSPRCNLTHVENSMTQTLIHYSSNFQLLIDEVRRSHLINCKIVRNYFCKLKKK